MFPTYFGLNTRFWWAQGASGGGGFRKIKPSPNFLTYPMGSCGAPTSPEAAPMTLEKGCFEEGKPWLYCSHAAMH